jgi:hypothetical protein
LFCDDNVVLRSFLATEALVNHVRGTQESIWNIKDL